jgi:hypothetical protein
MHQFHRQRGITDHRIARRRDDEHDYLRWCFMRRSLPELAQGVTSFYFQSRFRLDNLGRGAGKAIIHVRSANQHGGADYLPALRRASLSHAENAPPKDQGRNMDV